MRAPTRIVFDLSSSVRWGGTPGGLVRCQRELAGWARRRRAGILFAVFDPSCARYRTVSPAHLDALLAGEATINVWGWGDANGARGAPAMLRLAGRPKRAALTALEAVRLGSRGRTAAWADRLQRSLMDAAARRALVGQDGARRPFLDPAAALGETLTFVPGDILVLASWWAHAGAGPILQAKAERGLRLAALCYDLIPLVLPQLYDPRSLAAMEAWWRRILPACDLVAVNAQATARNVRTFCADWGAAAPPTGVFPLGADPAGMAAGADPLPDDLREGRYVLFVSTLGPHKGHAMICRAWAELMSAGAPGRDGFKLVFVGRPGWQKDPLEDQIASDPRLAGSVVRLAGVSDTVLDSLYRKSAFCIFPSLYEGYGLPVVEAFARGKAVLASDGGSLPEVVGDFSPVLPAGDQAAWRDAIGAWIVDPSLRAPFEAAIRERFRPVSWNEAAERFFALIDAIA